MSYSDRLQADRVQPQQVTGDLVRDIEAAVDAEGISLAMRKQVALTLAARIQSDEVGSGDLVKLLAMLNDRIDGKVVERHEHSGSFSLQAILASIDGTTTGLPSAHTGTIIDALPDSRASHADDGLAREDVLVSQDRLATDDVVK